MALETSISPHKDATSRQLNFNEILRILPQKPPFVMIDCVTELEKEKRIVAFKITNQNELLLLSQKSRVDYKLKFPETMISEAMGQAGIIFFKHAIDQLTKNLTIYLGAVDIHFFEDVLVGEKVIIEVTPVKLIGQAAILCAKASTNSKVMAQGEMNLSLGMVQK